MITITLLLELESSIKERHLLSHPFYQMWNAGTLPIEVMQKYAEQYYHLERAFPTFLSRMHADCSEFEVRQTITDNMYDEEHGENNHRELWLRFGEGIGASRQGMEESSQLPETKETIATFDTLSNQSFLEGSAALAAYESQIPEIAETKIHGLEKHYGITEERTLAFFRVHGILDKKHANDWWNIIEKYASTDELQTKVQMAVEDARDALWNFLTGICRAYCPEALEKCSM